LEGLGEDKIKIDLKEREWQQAVLVALPVSLTGQSTWYFFC